jgi:hypothetical protein
MITRILSFVGIVILAYVIFSRPREITFTEAPTEKQPEKPLASNPQPPKPRPRARPQPQPAQGVTFEPENQPVQQPIFRSLQPSSSQSAGAAENQRPVYRSPQPGQSQSFAAYDRVPGSVERGKPVEVWGGGDDELTARLRDALKDALRSSADFHLSSGTKPGTLVITLPSNVGSQPVGGRTQVLYTAKFASDGQNLGGSTGSCWDDALAKCAAQIVRDAMSAIRTAVP